VGLLVGGVAIAAVLSFLAIGENMLYFFSPTQVKAGEAPLTRNIRIGGLVVDGSLNREADGVTVRFDLTDNLHAINVRYRGILPDLFREGQGVVATGRLDPSGIFEAEEVLAKHDENYMPPEVAEALETARKGGAMPKASTE
jgi:cytochrome c-type biogenesis protein CcmE